MMRREIQGKRFGISICFIAPMTEKETIPGMRAGLRGVGYGDREVFYSTREDISPSGWFDGTTGHYYTDELEDYVLEGEDYLFEVWHA